MNDDVSRMSKKDLEREVKWLRRQLQEALSRDDAEILQGGNREALAIARRQRDQYKAERDRFLQVIEAYEHVYPDDLIPEPCLLDGPNAVEQGWTLIGLLMFFRDSATNVVHRFRANADFPGTIEEFENEAIPQLALAMTRHINLRDIGAQSIDGLEANDLENIITELLHEWFKHKDPEQQKQDIKDMFERAWPQMEASGKYDGANGKKKARDKFRVFCERTISYDEARRAEFRLPEPDENGLIRLRQLL